MTDVRRITRAEGRFVNPELDWENIYYAGTLDGEPYAWLHVQASPAYDFVMLHLALRGFSRRVLRECLADFAILKTEFRAAGIRQIFLMKECPFRSWGKLVRLLGFGAPQEILIAGTLYKAVCMEVS